VLDDADLSSRVQKSFHYSKARMRRRRRSIAASLMGQSNGIFRHCSSLQIEDITGLPLYERNFSEFCFVFVF
jgi:hypothetical protein